MATEHRALGKLEMEIDEHKRQEDAPKLEELERDNTKTVLHLGAFVDNQKLHGWTKARLDIVEGEIASVRDSLKQVEDRSNKRYIDLTVQMASLDASVRHGFASIDQRFTRSEQEHADFRASVEQAFIRVQQDHEYFKSHMQRIMQHLNIAANHQ